MPLFLTDDLAAREAATALGMQPTVSVGVILRAFRLGDLTGPEADASLVELDRRSSLFVTTTIIDLAREALRRPGA